MHIHIRKSLTPSLTRFLSVCVSICLSVCLSVCLPRSLSLSLSLPPPPLSIPHFVYFSVHLTLYISFCPPRLPRWWMARRIRNMSLFRRNRSLWRRNRALLRRIKTLLRRKGLLCREIGLIASLRSNGAFWDYLVDGCREVTNSPWHLLTAKSRSRTWSGGCVCVRKRVCECVCVCVRERETVCARSTGWLRLVGSLKVKVSLAKEPYKRDDTLQKRPIIWRSLLIVATP